MTDETIIDDPVDVNPLQPLINQAKAEKIEEERPNLLRIDVPNLGDHPLRANETVDEASARYGFTVPMGPDARHDKANLGVTQAYMAQWEAERPKDATLAWRNFKMGIADMFLPDEEILDNILYALNDTIGEPVPGLGGLLPSLPGLTEYLTVRDRKLYTPDPNFNLEERLAQDGNIDLINHYKGSIFHSEVKSEEAYQMRTKYLMNGIERQRQIQEAPTAYSVGEVASIALLPEAWLALGVRGGVRQILKQSAKVGTLTAIREFPQTDQTGDMSVAAANTFFAGVGTFALGGLFRVAGIGGQAIKTQRGTKMDAEEAAARTFMGDEVANNADISAQDGVLRPKNVPDPEAKAAGASASDTAERPQTLGEELQGNSVEKTWAFGDRASPISRILSSSDNNAKQLLLEVFEVVPKLMKNTAAFGNKATEQAIETMIRVRYRGDIGRLHQSLYDKYKKMNARYETGTFGTLAGVVGIRPNSRVQTAYEFRQMVAEAKRTGRRSHIPEVNEAVAEVDGILSKYFDEMMELGIPWDKQTRALKAASRAKNQAEVKRLEAEIEKIKKGLNANRKTYLPRMWRKDKIRENWEEFVSKIQTSGKLTRKEAERIARNLRDSKPFIDADDTALTGAASGFHKRELDFIFDDDFAEFLENDILTLMTTYSRTMAPDLEIYRRYGSINMESENIFTGELGPIGIVKQNFKARIDAASGDEAIKLAKERDSVIEDLVAMRDLLRGTYMMPVDPDRFVSKAIRIAKNFSAITLLTGAMAAGPDIARTVTANGLKKSMASLYDALMNNDVWKKGLAQNRDIGESFEFWLSNRAAQISDLGDTFGIHNRFESAVSGLASANFIINGMSLWNDFAKTATGIVTSTKILGDVEDLVLGKATAKQRERLAKSGIGQAEAESIYKMKDKWQRTDANIIANSSQWDNLVAKDAFDAALSKEINTVVVTPGLGERPLFMSNEYISLITQFKSFAMSSHQRVLIPAIQDADRNTLTQIALMTAIGSGVAYIRNEQLGGNEMTLDELLFEGVARAGWTGWFIDADNALHTVSGGSLSLQRAIGQGKFVTDRQRASGILGPAAGQAMQMANVAGDVLAGQTNAKEVKSLLPFGNIAHLNMLFDAVAESE